MHGGKNALKKLRQRSTMKRAQKKVCRVCDLAGGPESAGRVPVWSSLWPAGRSSGSCPCAAGAAAPVALLGPGVLGWELQWLRANATVHTQPVCWERQGKCDTLQMCR